MNNTILEYTLNNLGGLIVLAICIMITLYLIYLVIKRVFATPSRLSRIFLIFLFLVLAYLVAESIECIFPRDILYPGHLTIRGIGSIVIYSVLGLSFSVIFAMVREFIFKWKIWTEYTFFIYTSVFVGITIVGYFTGIGWEFVQTADELVYQEILVLVAFLLVLPTFFLLLLGTKFYSRAKELTDITDRRSLQFMSIGYFIFTGIFIAVIGLLAIDPNPSRTLWSIVTGIPLIFVISFFYIGFYRPSFIMERYKKRVWIAEVLE
ncbi:MAG: hypothetical protein ACFFC7_06220 [Candidatus Hermodarchaeota archaeon]